MRLRPDFSVFFFDTGFRQATARWAGIAESGSDQQRGALGCAGRCCLSRPAIDDRMSTQMFFVLGRAEQVPQIPVRLDLENA